jgi:hypothetical protein
MKRKSIAWLVVVILAVTVGCAAMTQVKGPQTPKEFAYYFMSVWNKQYDELVRQNAMPNKPPELVDLLKKRQAILIQSQPLIATYVAVVDSGGVPSPALEGQINALIDQLVYK